MSVTVADRQDAKAEAPAAAGLPPGSRRLSAAGAPLDVPGTGIVHHVEQPPPPAAATEEATLTVDCIAAAARTTADGIAAIAKLDLFGLGVTNIAALAQCRQLQVLSISHNSVASLRPLACCPRLRELYLRNNNISLPECRWLASLPELHVLWLTGNPCTQHQWFRPLIILLCKSLTKLDALDVGATNRDEALTLYRTNDGLRRELTALSRVPEAIPTEPVAAPLRPAAAAIDCAKQPHAAAPRPPTLPTPVTPVAGRQRALEAATQSTPEKRELQQAPLLRAAQALVEVLDGPALQELLVGVLEAQRQRRH